MYAIRSYYGPSPRPWAPSPALLQQLQRDLRLQVGLAEDRDRRLLQDRVAGQLGRLVGDVDVADPALRGRQP